MNADSKKMPEDIAMGRKRCYNQTKTFPETGWKRGTAMKKKGFTLVELIVVLVILAILAALLIPALTGYIDKANEEKLQATTRQVVVAAQSVVSEAYAENPELKKGNLQVNTFGNDNVAVFEEDENHIKLSDICELAEIAQDITKVEGFYKGKLKNGVLWVLVDYDNKGKVTSAQVGTASQYCTYNGTTGDYTVVKY